MPLQSKSCKLQENLILAQLVHDFFLKVEIWPKNLFRTIIYVLVIHSHIVVFHVTKPAATFSFTKEVDSNE